MHARIQIYWCRSSIFRHLKLELLTQFPASNDEKYINVVYIWRKFVSFYGYVHWRMTTEISVMYGCEKVKDMVSQRRTPYTKLPAELSRHLISVTCTPTVHHMFITLFITKVNDPDRVWSGHKILTDPGSAKIGVTACPEDFLDKIRSIYCFFSNIWKSK